MEENSYTVALTFPDNIAAVFSELREKYDKYVDYKIEPHITLVYPFAPVVDIMTVYEKLEEVAQRTEPFTLVFDGIKYFEGKVNVAYAAIEDKYQVSELYTDIHNSIEGLIKVEDIFENYNDEDFIPHMTISDDIPDEEFLGIKEALASYKLGYKCEITEFVLFSYESDGMWKRERVFKLTGVVN